MIMALLTVIIYILVLSVLYWLIDYVIRTVPVPDPPARIIRIACVVVFTIIVVLLLLGLIGVGGNSFGLPRLR